MSETKVVLEESTNDFLKALASPARQQVMFLFAGGAELSVGDVAEVFSKVKPAGHSAEVMSALLRL